MANSMIQTLARSIAVVERGGGVKTEVWISDADALELAGELASLQINPTRTKADIYLNMKAGYSKFMDRVVKVTDTGPTTT